MGENLWPSQTHIAVINIYSWRGQCNVRHLISCSPLATALCVFAIALHLNSKPGTRLSRGGDEGCVCVCVCVGVCGGGGGASPTPPPPPLLPFSNTHSHNTHVCYYANISHQDLSNETALKLSYFKLIFCHSATSRLLKNASCVFE